MSGTQHSARLSRSGYWATSGHFTTDPKNLDYPQDLKVRSWLKLVLAGPIAVLAVYWPLDWGLGSRRPCLLLMFGEGIFT
jgi:hypothetical protein